LIQGDPNAFADYGYNNFVIGNNEETVTYKFSASCCFESLTLNILDVAGNLAACTADNAGGRDSGDGQPVSGGTDNAALTIGIVVAVVVMLIVIAIAVVAVILIKKKRKAELEEMRETPQAR